MDPIHVANRTVWYWVEVSEKKYERTENYQEARRSPKAFVSNSTRSSSTEAIEEAGTSGPPLTGNDIAEHSSLG